VENVQALPKECGQVLVKANHERMLGMMAQSNAESSAWSASCGEYLRRYIPANAISTLSVR
jgi:hypothetical protein